MTIAPIAEVKAKFSNFVARSKKEAVIITKNGKPTAALIPINSDEDVERLMLKNSSKLKKIIQKSRQEFAAGKGISHSKAWEELEKLV